MRPADTAIDVPVVVEERRARTTRARRSAWTPERTAAIVLLSLLALIVLFSVLSLQCHWSALGDGIQCFDF